MIFFIVLYRFVCMLVYCHLKTKGKNNCWQIFRKFALKKLKKSSLRVPQVTTLKMESAELITIKRKFRKDEENDLTIIYNDEFEFQTSKIRFFSKLRKYQTNACSILQILDQNRIYIKDKYSNKLFKKFIQIISTDKMAISENNYLDLLDISAKYGYYEMRDQIIEFIEKRPDIKRMVEDIKNSQNKNDKENGENEGEDNSIKEEIIAKHLDESLRCGILDQLRVSTLIRIFESPKRRLLDHHLLFEFIINLFNSYQKDKRCIENESKMREIQTLTSCLDYSQMTKDEIRILLSHELFSTDFQPTNTSNLILSLTEENSKLKSIVKNVILENKALSDSTNEMKAKFEETINKNKEDLEEIKAEMRKQKELKERKRNTILFLNKPFEGIFNELTKRNSKRNINDCGVITIISNGPGSPNCGTLSSIVDFSTLSECFFSKNEANSYICFDLNNHEVILSSYSVKSSHSNRLPVYLRSWVVEGSKEREGSSWIELDRHTNDDILCQSDKVATFHIQDESKKKEKFKRIQIRSTGRNQKNSFSFDLTKFEIFGEYF